MIASVRFPLLTRLPARATANTAPPARTQHPETSNRDQYPDIEDWAWEIIQVASPLTMTSPERVYALLGAVGYIVANDVPGAVLECGVWKGGSMIAAATRLLQLGQDSRDLYLFDTYDGMPAPTHLDADLHGVPAEALLAGTSRDSAVDGEPNLWCYAGVEAVKASLESSGYPPERCHYVVGRVEDTVPGEAPTEIALLRLDTDWYESTRHELEHLYDRLMPGGVLLIDDYGHWLGARRATDDFFNTRGIHPLLHRIDYTGRLHVKPLA